MLSDTVAPDVAEIATAARIGLHEELIPAIAVRNLWRLHGGFGFGETFPPRLIDPLARAIHGATVSPPTFNVLARRQVHRTIRMSFCTLVRMNIVRANLSPQLGHPGLIINLAQSIVEERHLSIDMTLTQYVEARRQAILQVTDTNQKTWKYRTLADTLLQLLPHLTTGDLDDPGRGWAHLYRFNHAVRQCMNYAAMSDRDKYRMNTWWHLAIYQAALQQLADLRNDPAQASLYKRTRAFLERIIAIAAQPAVI